MKKLKMFFKIYRDTLLSVSLCLVFITFIVASLFLNDHKYRTIYGVATAEDTITTVDGNVWGYYFDDSENTHLCVGQEVSVTFYNQYTEDVTDDVIKCVSIR